MFNHFESLPEEKKKKIIDICIDEFSRNGYRNASTNIIIKKAGISKGILFHYFGSKKALYLYMLDYTIDFFIKLYHQWLTGLPSDFFERITKLGLLKLKAAYEHPVFYRFLLDSYTHAPDELKNDMQKRYSRIMVDQMPFLYKGIDMSGFRGDIDHAKAIELIAIALEGIGNKYIRMFENTGTDDIVSQMQRVYAQYFEYIDLLKKVMYVEK